MRQIFAIAWNDIKMEFSSRWTLLFFLVLPIVFTAILGAALGGSSQDAVKITIPYTDLDRSTCSNQFLNSVDQNGLLDLQAYPRQSDALAAFTEKRYTATMVIPAGFCAAVESGQSSSVRLIENPSDTILSVEQTIQSAARQLGYAYSIARVTTDKASALSSFPSEQARSQFSASVLNSAQSVLAAPSVKLEAISGGNNKVIANGFSQSSPGQLVTWVMITLLAGSEVFVSERLGGTLRRLMITPNNKAVIISGKILGRFILGMIQMSLLVGFGALVLRVNWGRDPLALIVMLVAFGLAGTAFGVMLGAFARTRGQAGSLSVMFSMLLSALGGAWWPLEITPAVYQSTVKILPTTWAMTGLTDVIVRGKSLVQILPQAGILIGFALLFFFIGIWKLRYE